MWCVKRCRYVVCTWCTPHPNAHHTPMHHPHLAHTHTHTHISQDIMAHLKEQGVLIDHASIVHSYPFCWRSDQPLLYKAVPSWFVAVESIKERLLENNLTTRWVPAYVQEKRFHNWLENAHDWAISRSRCVFVVVCFMVCVCVLRGVSFFCVLWSE